MVSKKKKLLDEITPELKEQIENKISWEGLDYYLDEGGYAKEDFEGTALEPLLDQFLDAKAELVSALQELDIEL